LWASLVLHADQCISSIQEQARRLAKTANSGITTGSGAPVARLTPAFDQRTIGPNHLGVPRAIRCITMPAPLVAGFSYAARAARQ
jgi:hypothetical protein